MRSKEVVSPSQRREAVAWAQTAHQVSQRCACRALDVERTVVRYHARRDPATALRRRLHMVLRRDRLAIYYKLVHRLYVEEEPQPRPLRRRRRKATTLRQTRTVPAQPNERWTRDFINDVLKNGRTIRVIALFDACTRECVSLHAAVGFRAVSWRRSSPPLSHSVDVYRRSCDATNGRSLRRWRRFTRPTGTTPGWTSRGR